jgi:hypothetical protein
LTVKIRQSVSEKLKSISVSNPQRVKISESEIAVPTDQQVKYSKTIQTHTNVAVGPSAFSVGTWIDTEGFSEIGLTVTSNTAQNAGVNIGWSNDGITNHGRQNGVITLGTSAQDGSTDLKSRARYMQVTLNNQYTAPVTMNSFIYLKV